MSYPYKDDFKVTQTFKGKDHKGMDLVGLKTKEIYSTVNGIVERAGWDSSDDRRHGMGLYVRISERSTSMKHYFAHLSVLNVKVGQEVKEGDLIGVEGNTGHSTGSHMHYEVRKSLDNKSFVDCFSRLGIDNKLGVVRVVEVRTKITSPYVAIKILKQAGIINTETYWHNAIETTKYVPELLCSFATYVINQK